MRVYHFFVKLGFLRPLDEVRKIQAERAEIRRQQQIEFEKNMRRILAKLKLIFKMNTRGDQ